ncbi:MAG: metallophosphoesterase [Thermoguttaceae bacterium]|nr:metallophosphoesterase [Thermoguttaceae bacterium]
MPTPQSSQFTRRGFFGASLGTALTASTVASTAFADAAPAAPPAFPETSFALTGADVKIYSKAIAEPVRVLQISDTHLFLDDERGDDYRDYSKRMAAAYNKTKHFKTGADTNPIDELKKILADVSPEKYDAVVLTGDIVSFPSAAGVDFLLENLGATGVPYYYIAGNHDWHFEGLPGSSAALRAEWTSKILAPLYPKDADPLAYSVDVKGVKLLLVDDSTYEILPEQLDFVRRELAAGRPTALFMHIPLYAPGRGVGYGVAHPKWGAASDGGWKVERRERWPEAGHSETTFAFRRDVLAAPNLVGVFTGHVHVSSLNVCEGKANLTARAAVDGSTTKIEFLPLG